MEFSSLDEYFMRRAMDLASDAEREGEIPVGAVLVRQNRILSEGKNTSISSHDPTAHAEIRAIRDAGAILGNYRLTDTTIYVTLEPCAMCAGALLHSRVSRIVYGASDQKAGAAGTVLNVLKSPVAYHHADINPGLLGAQCRSQLITFFRRRRKEKKLKNTNDT